MTTILWQIALQFILIFLNAVFACAEIAIISINDARIDQLAAAGDKRAVKLKKLTEQPSGFLATIQIAITLSGFSLRMPLAMAYSRWVLPTPGGP